MSSWNDRGTHAIAYLCLVHIREIIFTVQASKKISSRLGIFTQRVKEVLQVLARQVIFVTQIFPYDLRRVGKISPEFRGPNNTEESRSIFAAGEPVVPLPGDEARRALLDLLDGRRGNALHHSGVIEGCAESPGCSSVRNAPGA